ncbi:hypothetical protein C8Q76DRAFT_770754 [Earliella scabrosa]|nr:hypothetical protein C8Q76DRAFT_770754 [Earliella scabrosa]
MSGPRQTPGAAALAKESYIIPDALYVNLEDSVTWNTIILRLSDALKLPDLSTRHGLRKIHTRFDGIYKRLNATYTAARRDGDEKAMGGVVGIMARMCADALLRDRLFEKGILQKIMPLLELDSTRHLALNALGMVTHHGGAKAREEIARLNKTLIKLVQDHPDDPHVAELAMITMDHATEAIIAVEQPPSPAVLKEVGVRLVLETAMATLRKPAASRGLLTHSFSLLVSATQHCSTYCEAIPGVVGLLAAFTRSKNIIIRAQAMGALLRLPISECEPDAMGTVPLNIMEAARRGPPEHLRDILWNYGPERSELCILVNGTAEYMQAIKTAAQDHDMYALGLKLVDLIQRAEYIVLQGGWQNPDGSLMTERDGIPFSLWTDSLPLAAKALRAKGSPSDLDAADIVDLKYFVIKLRTSEALDLARKVIKRNPQLAYAYYALSLMGSDPEEGLRAVKKGLKCPNVTPFVRCQMLWRAAYHAGERGLSILQEAIDNNPVARAEGEAFLRSAWEDTKTYISEAPPDTRHLLGMISWYILLTVTIRGLELSEDLTELDPARRKMSSRVSRWSSCYTPGVQEWGSLVNRYDELDEGEDEHASGSPAQTEDDLAQWLGSVVIDDADEYGKESGGPPGGASSHYELFRCSWCGNPSAALRKCGGCGETKYCDGACQKLHWAEHKTDCKGRVTR